MRTLKSQKFIIEINTDNAAFSEMPSNEIIRILKELCETAYHDGFAGMKQSGKTALRDVNGNTVGKFDLINA